MAEASSSAVGARSKNKAGPIGFPDNKLDERRIATGVAFALPAITLMAAGIIGIIMGPATAILVVAAGLLLGVIAILWASLRILSGDAPLSPELEALEMSSAQGVDALASRKKMLLRALKDLESEKGIGKIEEEDYAQIAGVYREELKVVLRRIDASLDPHRGRAEEAARMHLRKAGLLDAGYRGEPAPVPDVPESDEDVAEHAQPTKATRGSERLVCPKCDESNEPDAKFCKECATKLTPKASAKKTADADASAAEEDADDEEDDSDA